MEVINGEFVMKGCAENEIWALLGIRVLSHEPTKQSKMQLSNNKRIKSIRKLSI